MVEHVDLNIENSFTKIVRKKYYAKNYVCGRFSVEFIFFLYKLAD